MRIEALRAGSWWQIATADTPTGFAVRRWTGLAWSAWRPMTTEEYDAEPPERTRVIPSIEADLPPSDRRVD